MIKVRGLSYVLSSAIIVIECLIFGVFPLPFDLFFHNENTPVSETITEKPVFIVYGLLPVTGLLVNCTAKLYSMRILFKMKSRIPQVFTITRSSSEEQKSCPDEERLTFSLNFVIILMFFIFLLVLSSYTNRSVRSLFFTF
jgi:hypothetical protein